MIASRCGGSQLIRDEHCVALRIRVIGPQDGRDGRDRRDERDEAGEGHAGTEGRPTITMPGSANTSRPRFYNDYDDDRPPSAGDSVTTLL